MGETGGALVGGAHRELGGDADAVLRASRQVQPVGLFVAASETVSVVRAEELTGCGGIGVPHGRYGVGGGVRAAEVPLTGADLTRASWEKAHRAKLDRMELSTAPFEERLTAPRSWWLVSLLLGVACALIMLPFGTLPLLGGWSAGRPRRPW